MHLKCGFQLCLAKVGECRNSRWNKWTRLFRQNHLGSCLEEFKRESGIWGSQKSLLWLSPLGFLLWRVSLICEWILRCSRFHRDLPVIYWILSSCFDLSIHSAKVWSQVLFKESNNSYMFRSILQLWDPTIQQLLCLSDLLQSPRPHFDLLVWHQVDLLCLTGKH